MLNAIASSKKLKLTQSKSCFDEINGTGVPTKKQWEDSWLLGLDSFFAGFSRQSGVTRFVSGYNTIDFMTSEFYNDDGLRIPYFVSYEKQGDSLINPIYGPSIQIGEELEYFTASPVAFIGAATVAHLADPLWSSPTSVQLYKTDAPNTTLGSPFVFGTPTYPYHFLTNVSFAGDFSDDGKYLPYTYIYNNSNEVPTPAEADIVPKGARIGILSTAGNTLSSVVEIEASFGGITPAAYTSQYGAILRRKKCGPGYWLILTPTNADDDTFAPAGAASIQVYDFASHLNPPTLTLVGETPLNQSVMGYDLNDAQDRLVVITRQADPADPPLSVIRDPEGPLPVYGTDPAEYPPANLSELRLYNFNSKNGEVEIIAASPVDMRGARVRWITVPRCGGNAEYLALTERAYGVITITENEVDDTYLFSAPPGILALLKFYRSENQFTWQDIKQTAPLAFGLASYSGASGVFVAVTGAANPPQQDIQLYKVVDIEDVPLSL